MKVVPLGTGLGPTDEETTMITSARRVRMVLMLLLLAAAAALALTLAPAGHATWADDDDGWMQAATLSY